MKEQHVFLWQREILLKRRHCDVQTCFSPDVCVVFSHLGMNKVCIPLYHEAGRAYAERTTAIDGRMKHTIHAV
jgi:hypothetical protein